MLTDPTPPELAPALHRNMLGYWAPYGGAKNCFLSETRDVVWFYTGIGHRLFNGVMTLATDTTGVHSLHGAVTTKIAAHGVPVSWWISPTTSPKDCGALLESLGLAKAGQVPAWPSTSRR